MSLSLPLVVLSLVLGGLSQVDPPAKDPAAAPPAQTEELRAIKHAAVIPAERVEKWCQDRHAAFNARAAQGAEKGDIGVIFLGDSITQGWEGAGKKVWDEFYGNRAAVNMGIGGDRTQHILWRLAHGNVDGLAKPKSGSPPKLVVLMIGTNNSNGKDHTAPEIADGIKAIVADLRERLPETRVLLLSIFPRGEKPNPQREKNAEASRLAAAIADGRMVHSLDIGPAFLEKDSTLSKEIMPDHLHLSEAGYRRWAEAMEGKVRELLGEMEGDAPRPTADAPKTSPDQ